jgi:signal peptidase I
MTTVPRVREGAASTRWARLEDPVTFAGWLVASYVGSVFLWVAIPALVFGWQPLVVISGSMTPLIRSGDLVLVDDQRDGIGPGTIIAFHSRLDEVVLHRVIANGPDGGYRTQGDRNLAPDSDSVQPTDVIGTGRMLVPSAGLPRGWGLGWPVAVTVMLAGAVLAWRPRRSWAIALLAAAISMGGVGWANASFADATSSAGSSLSAVTVAPATGLAATCGAASATNVDVDLAWTASATLGITNYQIMHDAPGGGTSFAVVGTVNGSTTTFTHSFVVALFGTGTHTYTVRATMGSWASVNSNTDAVNVTQIVLVYVCSTL